MVLLRACSQLLSAGMGWEYFSWLSGVDQEHLGKPQGFQGTQLLFKHLVWLVYMALASLCRQDPASPWHRSPAVLYLFYP